MRPESNTHLKISTKFKYSSSNNIEMKNIVNKLNELSFLKMHVCNIH